MKNVLLILGLAFGLTASQVQAQEITYDSNGTPHARFDVKERIAEFDRLADAMELRWPNIKPVTPATILPGIPELAVSAIAIEYQNLGYGTLDTRVLIPFVRKYCHSQCTVAKLVTSVLMLRKGAR